MYHELWNASIVFLILGGLCFLAAQICNACSYRYLRYPSRAEARVIDIVAVPREGNQNTTTGLRRCLSFMRMGVP